MFGKIKDIFGKGKPLEEVKKPKREKSALERIKENRALNGRPKVGLHKTFDKEAALKRCFPRQGVGTNKGICITPDVPMGSAANGASDAPRGTVATDASEEGGAEAARRQDQLERMEYFNPLSRWGMDEKVLELYESRVFIGFPAMAQIATHEIVCGALDIPAKDAIAKGYTIDIANEGGEESDKDNDGVDEKNADMVRKILKVADGEHRIGNVCRNFCFQKREFGVAYAVPIFKDEENHDYSKPFNPDGIAKDSFIGMKVIEPIWMSWEFKKADANNPLAFSFYEPEWYRVQGNERIHKSWVVKAIHVPVSDLKKPTYYFGGMSLTQMIYERMYCADKCANEAPMLVMTKRLLVADANVQAMLSDDTVAKKTMESLNYFRDNFSVFFKNPNTQVNQIDTSLEGVAQTGMTMYQLCAAIAGMPVTKLMKNVPTGLQSTGDYEMADYHELLTEIQEHDYKPLMDMYFKCLTKSMFGKVIDVVVKFNPLDTPKRGEIVQEESSLASTISTYLTANVITIEEARDILRKRKDGFFSGIGKVLPETLEKRKQTELAQLDQQIQQAKQPQNPMGGMGGEPTAENDPAAQEEEQLTSQAVAEAEKVIQGNGAEGGKEEEGGENAEQPPSKESAEG